MERKVRANRLIGARSNSLLPLNFFQETGSYLLNSDYEFSLALNFSVTATCGGSTNNNCTYFQNNGYPSTYDSVGSCQLTVNKCATGVCQLR